MPLVRFLPSETEIEVAEGESLLQAAQDAGIAIATVCGGRASCTECKIRVVEGQEHLSPMDFDEESMLGNVFYITKERLACQTHALGPLTVEVVKEQNTSKGIRGRERALRRAKDDMARRAARDEARREREEARGGGGGARPRPPRADRPERRDPPERSQRDGDAPPRSAASEGGAEGATKPPGSGRRRRRRRRTRGGGGGDGGGGGGKSP